MIAAKLSAHPALNFSNFIAPSSFVNPANHTTRLSIRRTMIIVLVDNTIPVFFLIIRLEY